MSIGPRIISKCDVKGCDGIHRFGDGITQGCGDPCSFVMRKAGAGVPPYISEETIVDEITLLLARRSRGEFF